MTRLKYRLRSIDSLLRITKRGGTSKTEEFLVRVAKANYEAVLHTYGKKGVLALKAFTPSDTGETAGSWTYSIEKTKTGYRLIWSNTHMAGDVPVAVLLQYGHATRSGAFVEGVDFINPALQIVFKDLAKDLWKEAAR